jgi:hypothetical protein
LAQLLKSEGGGVSLFIIATELKLDEKRFEMNEPREEVVVIGPEKASFLKGCRNICIQGNTC